MALRTFEPHNYRKSAYSTCTALRLRVDFGVVVSLPRDSFWLDSPPSVLCLGPLQTALCKWAQPYLVALESVPIALDEGELDATVIAKAPLRLLMEHAKAERLHPAGKVTHVALREAEVHAPCRIAA